MSLACVWALEVAPVQVDLPLPPLLGLHLFRPLPLPRLLLRIEPPPRLLQVVLHHLVLVRQRLPRVEERSQYELCAEQVLLLLLLLLLLWLLLFYSVFPRRRRVSEGSGARQPSQVLLELLPEGTKLFGNRGAPAASAVVGLGRARPAPSVAINGGLNTRQMVNVCTFRQIR